MATAKTWLWIILSFVAFCVLCLCLMAGAGVYYVSKHISVRHTSSPQALRSLEEARARFTVPPLLELDRWEHPRETRPIAELPSATRPPTNLYVLAWEPDDEKLARVVVPFWMLRLGRRKIEFLKSSRGFNYQSLNLDLDQLE